jgi:SAM-dependent methyltransferase
MEKSRCYGRSGEAIVWDRGPSASVRFWDRAAREDAAWYVATAYSEQSPAFFAQGARETDELLRLCAVQINPADTVLELGCGVGRMTGRLAELSRTVIATDISAEMLARARTNLSGCGNVAYLILPGDGRLPLRSESVDVVFSYLVLQHVPTVDAQLQYLREAVRVLCSGGRLAMQIRAAGLNAAVHDQVGHVVHLLQGRRTLSRAWRGARLPYPWLARLGGTNVDVKLRPFGHRHAWVVARKR